MISLNTDQTITFIDSGVNGDFFTLGNEITYTTGSAWYDADIYSFGQGLPRPSLDVVLAHEIAHTPVGLSAFNLTPINTALPNGNFSASAIRADEVRASTFENSYRRYRGLDLRRKTYVTPVPQ